MIKLEGQPVGGAQEAGKAGQGLLDAEFKTIRSGVTDENRSMARDFLRSGKLTVQAAGQEARSGVRNVTSGNPGQLVLGLRDLLCASINLSHGVLNLIVGTGAALAEKIAGTGA